MNNTNNADAAPAAGITYTTITTTMNGAPVTWRQAEIGQMGVLGVYKSRDLAIHGEPYSGGTVLRDATYRGERCVVWLGWPSGSPGPRPIGWLVYPTAKDAHLADAWQYSAEAQAQHDRSAAKEAESIASDLEEARIAALAAGPDSAVLSWDRAAVAAHRSRTYRRPA